jgi:hypothetical protein
MVRSNAQSGFGVSHLIRFAYDRKVDFDKAVATGWLKKSDKSGVAYPRIYKPKKGQVSIIDDVMDIYLDGSLCLDYIPETDIHINPYTGDKTITAKLITINESGAIFTCIGTIYINRICASDITYNPRTRLKNVRCYLKKVAMSDSFNSTHALLLFRDDQTEVEIGRFKQVKDLNVIRQRMEQYKVAPPLPTQPEVVRPTNAETPKRPTKPLVIDGFKF